MLDTLEYLNIFHNKHSHLDNILFYIRIAGNRADDEQVYNEPAQKCYAALNNHINLFYFQPGLHINDMHG